MKDSAQTVVIRRATEDDIAALKDFYTEYFPDKPVLLDMQLWKWTFLQTPLQHTGIPFFIIEDKGDIKGGIGYLAVKFQVGSEMFQGFHPVNFFVDTTYKGLHTLRLLRNVMGENQVGFVSYFTEDAAKLFKAARWIDLSQHVKNYYFSLHLPEASNVSFFRSIKFRLIRSVRLAWVHTLQLYLKYSYGSKVRVVRKTQLCESLFPQKALSMENRIGVTRDQVFLTWRYENSPRLDCVYFYATENEESVALAVLHINKKDENAVILDIIYGDCANSTLMVLIISIINFCHREQLKILSTTMLNEKLHRILINIGFSASKSEFGLMAVADQKEVKNKFSETQHWDYWIGHSDIY